jgi:cytoplasmic iron level regulating protein YaaA (DUF328/UPF0246 family)
MKILLAPSESKNSGGSGKFTLEQLSFRELTPTRKELVAKYEQILQSGNIEQIKELFGIKKEQELQKYLQGLNTPTLKAIERYSGVAFDYIEYSNLEQSAKEYIDKNVILFSNLFGPILASDPLPLYKVKQGSTLDGIKPEQLYSKAAKEPLDRYLENEEILDLRAGFYNKFYKPSRPYTTLKFLKGGKVVSHWAKAYRGIVLKAAANAQLDSVEALIAHPIPTLSLLEIRKSKTKQEIIYEIED